MRSRGGHHQGQADRLVGRVLGRDAVDHAQEAAERHGHSSEPHERAGLRPRHAPPAQGRPAHHPTGNVGAGPRAEFQLRAPAGGRRRARWGLQQRGVADPRQGPRPTGTQHGRVRDGARRPLKERCRVPGRSEVRHPFPGGRRGNPVGGRACQRLLSVHDQSAAPTAAPVRSSAASTCRAIRRASSSGSCRYRSPASLATSARTLSRSARSGGSGSARNTR